MSRDIADEDDVACHRGLLLGLASSISASHHRT
jgi:hypothetical protein